MGEMLIEFEREAEEAGEPSLFLFHKALHLACVPDWEEAHLNIRVALHLPVDEDPPKLPHWNITWHDPTLHPLAPDQLSAKHKVQDDSGDGPDSIMATAQDLKCIKTAQWPVPMACDEQAQLIFIVHGNLKGHTSIVASHWFALPHVC